jgi:hypothetical protein
MKTDTSTATSNATPTSTSTHTPTDSAPPPAVDGQLARTTILGASVWEQELYDHIVNHIETERSAIQHYSAAAERSSSRAFSYLTSLILEDERRHHRMMAELAESIRKFAELGGELEPIPPLDHPKNAEELLAATERMLKAEKADRKDLARLSKDLKLVSKTTLWQLAVVMRQYDTEKHIKILEFARDWLRSA